MTAVAAKCNCQKPENRDHRYSVGSLTSYERELPNANQQVSELVKDNKKRRKIRKGKRRQTSLKRTSSDSSRLSSAKKIKKKNQQKN